MGIWELNDWKRDSYWIYGLYKISRILMIIWIQIDGEVLNLVHSGSIMLYSHFSTILQRSTFLPATAVNSHSQSYWQFSLIDLGALMAFQALAISAGGLMASTVLKTASKTNKQKRIVAFINWMNCFLL